MGRLPTTQTHSRDSPDSSDKPEGQRLGPETSHREARAAGGSHSQIYTLTYI